MLDQARVPYTVQGLIQVRLEQLPANLSAVFGAASVIGNEFARDLLNRIPDRAVGVEPRPELRRSRRVR